MAFIGRLRSTGTHRRRASAYPRAEQYFRGIIPVHSFEIHAIARDLAHRLPYPPSTTAKPIGSDAPCRCSGSQLTSGKIPCRRTAHRPATASASESPAPSATSRKRGRPRCLRRQLVAYLVEATVTVFIVIAPRCRPISDCQVIRRARGVPTAKSFP